MNLLIHTRKNERGIDVTEVLNAQTGEAIKYVTKVEITCTPKGNVAVIHVLNPTIHVQATTEGDDGPKPQGS